jgi:steroid delta-isomerase-like uncharacterized protein
MATAQHLRLCRDFAQKVINERYLALLPDFLAPDSVHHEIVAEAPFGEGPPAAWRGPRAMARWLGAYLCAFPDLAIVFEDALTCRDRVVTRWRFEGTHAGPLPGIPATGRRVSVEGIRIDRIEGGKIAESWMQWDRLGMLEQIGALPALRQESFRLLRRCESALPATN